MDHDLLADYVGGALDGTPEHERVADLIATSPEWGRAADELSAALDAVQNDLNLLRHTAEPMPEDLAARFEGLFDGPRRDPLDPRVVAPYSGQAGRGRAKRWKRWAGPLAVAAAALALFAIVRLPAAVMEPAMDAAGGRNESQLSADAPAAAPPAPIPTVMSWQRYDRGSLGGALTASGIAPYSSVPTDSPQRGSTEKANTDGPASMRRLLDPSGLQQCLKSVNAVLPGRVDLVEYAYFEGNPAVVISITSNDGRWWFVAGANCGQLGPDEQYRAPLK